LVTVRVRFAEVVGPGDERSEVGVSTPQPAAGADEVERRIEALRQPFADAVVEALLRVHAVASKVLAQLNERTSLCLV
jgi:hypothetical protein